MNRNDVLTQKSVTDVNTSEVSLLEYIIIRKGGKKYLSMKFKNKSIGELHSVNVKLVERNSQGETLNSTHVTYSGYKVAAKKTFVPTQLYMLHPFTTDIEFEIEKSDLDYSMLSKEELENSKKVKTKVKEDFYFKEISNKRPVKLAFGISMLLVLFAAIVVGATYMYRKSNRIFDYWNYEYQFVDENGSTKDDSDIIITKYNGNDTDIVLKSYIKNHKIVGVGSDAFENKLINTLRVESDMYFSEYAFRYSALDHLVVSSSCTVLANAFADSRITNVEFEGSASLEDKAFSYARIDSVFFKDINNYNGTPFVNSIIMNLTISNAKELSKDSKLLNGLEQNIESLAINKLPEDTTLEALFGGTPKCLKKIELYEAPKSIPDFFAYSASSLETMTMPGFTGSIGKSAFEETRLENENFISGATSIGVAAFQNTSLIKVDLSKATSIGNSAFYECNNLASVVLSDSLEAIGENTFGKCNLRSITFPNALKTIGAYAFSNNPLGNVVFNDGLLSIGNYAFSGCDIQSIELQGSVQLGEKVFLNNSNVSKITAPLGNENSLDYLGISDRSDIVYLNLINKTFIADHEFDGCTSLRTYVFDENTESIGAYAFKDTSLSTVNIPDTVAYIGENAFEGCISIIAFQTPFCGPSKDDEQKFSYFGIEEVDKITSLKLGGYSVIEENEFSAFTSLTSIEFENTIQVKDYAFKGTMLTSLVLPETVEYIGTGILAGTKIETLDIPFLGQTKDDTTNCTLSYLGIEKSQTLKEVTLHSGTYIGLQAFSSCSWLSKITLPDGLLKIDKLAFENTALTSLYIPDSVEYIGDNILEGTQIRSLTIPFLGKTINNADGIEYVLGSNYKEITSNMTSLSITKAKALEAYSFVNMRLSRVELPETLVTINSNAIYGCTFDELVIPSSVKNITSGILDSTKVTNLTLPHLELDYLSKDSLTLNSLGVTNVSKLTILSGTISGNSCYNINSLRSVTIGAEVKEIGYYAFQSCYSLETLVFEEESKLSKIQDGAFSSCNQLRSITIPDSVVQIGSGAFRYCYLENVDISTASKLKTIGSEAFYGNKLTSILVPSEVSLIDSCAFQGNMKLLSVINKSSLDIKIGQVANGHVAYYALFVTDDENEKLNIISTNEYQLAVVGNNAYIMDYLIKNQGSNKKLTLPTEINDSDKLYKILGVAGSMLEGSGSVTELVVPKEYTMIHSGAFQNAYNLQSVEFNASIDAIPEDCFSSCQSLTSIIINSDITRINSHAFANCMSLKEFTIPETVEELSSYCFSWCSSMNKINGGESLKYIGYNAFYYCQSLSSFVLPASLETVEWDAFYQCGSLFVVYNLSNLKITIGDSNNGRVAFYALAIYNSLDDEKLVTFVDDSAHNAKWALINEELYLVSYTESNNQGTITLPSSLVYNNATYNSYTLHSNAVRDTSANALIVPGACKTVQSCAIYSSFRLVQFEEGVEIIESNAIDNSSFYALSFPKSLKKNEMTTYYRCVYIFDEGGSYMYPNSVYYYTNEPLSSYGFFTTDNIGYMYVNDELMMTSYNDKKTLPSQVKNNGKTYSSYGIAPELFTWSNMTSLTIPSSVKWIGCGAFNYCSSLTRVTFDEGCEYIGESAFNQCESLTSISIPESINYIGNYAFPSNVEKNSLDSLSYYGNTNNPYIYCVGTEKEKSTYKIHSSCKMIGPSAFSDNSTVTSVTIPEGVKIIGDYAFSNCVNLKSVTLPSSVSIGNNAFFYCSNLTLDASAVQLTSIGQYSFYESGLTAVNLEGLTRIPYQCFGNTKLSEVFIPNTIKTIEEYGFYGCSIKSLKLEDNTTLTYIGNYAFGWNSQLTGTFTVPKSVTYLGQNFLTRTQITVVAFESGCQISSLSNRTFAHCSSLESITLPKGITEIPDECFNACISLKTIKFEDEITYIGKRAFSNCYNLTNFTIPDTVTYIGPDAFFYVSCIEKTSYNGGNYYGTKDNPYLCLESIDDKSITSLDIHPDTKYIGCSIGITSACDVTIPANITYVGYNLCYSSNNQQIIHFISATPPEFYNNVGQFDTLTIYVPKGSLQAYKEKANNNSMKSYVIIEE